MAALANLAGIQYHGIAGSSQDCLHAVIRLLQYGRMMIVRARILSQANTHCLLLTDEFGDLIAIKSGFTSGYSGGGPRCFSQTLQLLQAHNVEIDEYNVDELTIQRIDRSALTKSDLEDIQVGKAIRPARWSDYICDEDYESLRDRTLWKELPLSIPLPIIDSRIMDLALSFWTDADNNILRGYRRLEDTVRQRTNLNEHGSKLFSKAFLGESAHLHWRGIEESEKIGRTNIFVGAYMAHRNPRAHQELAACPASLLSEFLLLNQLFLLEKEAESID